MNERSIFAGWRRPPDLTQEAGPVVQRKCGCGKSTSGEGECEDCKKKEYLQRRATGSDGPFPAPAIVHEEVSSPGQPLDSKTRQAMESRFGHDFGSVRVHTGDRAAASAQSIHAHAYTAGQEVVFGPGQYRPESPSGQRLIAHELAHVVQQSGMGAPGAQSGLTVGPANDSLERAADRSAEHAVGARHAPVAPVPSHPVQRAAARAETPAAGVAAPKTPGGLIVDDEARDLATGQMRKSQFLGQLRTSACAAADAELRALGRSTEGCPYVERWIQHFYSSPGSHVERAVHRYAPESAGVAAASDYIPLVVERIRRGVTRWATTGQITEVPDELKGKIAGGGVAGAIGGALGAVGGAIAGAASAVAGGIGKIASGIGSLFSKPRQGGGSGETSPAAVQARLRNGAPLEGGVRSRMESAFGHDFSRVRIHAGGVAAQISEGFNARAFTVGPDVAFGHGEYRPGSPAGDALLAHELAHVVQQGDGRAPHPVGGGSTEYGNLEQDADASAAGVLATLWGGAAGSLERMKRNTGPRLRSGLRLQRCTPSLRPVTPSTGGDIDTMLQSTKSALAPYIAERFNKGTRIAGHVHVLPEEKFKAAFLQYITTVKGAPPREQAEKITITAFVSGGEIFIKEGLDFGSVVHESIHALYNQGGKTDFADQLGLRAYEGATEYFTRIICAENQVPRDTDKYDKEFAVVKKVADRVGPDVMADAYFNGNVNRLMQEYNAKMNDKAAFDSWKAELEIVKQDREFEQ